MAKIAMIGAGSAGFCRTLVQDILQFDAMKDSHIALMDIDGRRLKTTHAVMQNMKAQHGLACRFTATTDLKIALGDADFAVSMIQVGGLKPYKLDIEIPKKYGIDQCVGDTMNPGGIFRGLRHVPALLEMLRVMDDVARPGIIFMNYANPMAICSWAMQNTCPHIQSVGLCHGVQHTSRMLCTWLGVPRDECDILTAGINHMAWFLRLEHRGKDLYPRIWKKLKRHGAPEREKYRFEMMKATGYFMTESSAHLSEYLPYFRNRSDLKKRFDGPGWAGSYGLYYHMCVDGYERYTKKMKDWSSGRKPVQFGHDIPVEYASHIMNATLTGEPFCFAGNILNKGFITNLPQDCCVEIPVFVDRRGLHGSHVGKLPEQCAGLCMSNISVQKLAVKAAVEGDYEAAYHACLLDPLTAAVLAPHEIRAMVDEMFAAQRRWLPQFRGKRPTAPGHSIDRLPVLPPGKTAANKNHGKR